MMNKKKPLIGLLGASALAGGAYAFVRNIYRGSKFLDNYVDKVEKIDVNSTFELEEDGYYAIRKNDNKPFRVLQLTDIHIAKPVCAAARRSFSHQMQTMRTHSYMYR